MIRLEKKVKLISRVWLAFLNPRQQLWIKSKNNKLTILRAVQRIVVSNWARRNCAQSLLASPHKLAYMFFPFFIRCRGTTVHNSPLLQLPQKSAVSAEKRDFCGANKHTMRWEREGLSCGQEMKCKALCVKHGYMRKVWNGFKCIETSFFIMRG